MNYAIVTLFGFLCGVLITIQYLTWSLNNSEAARRPIIRFIHDRHATEFYAYCDSVCKMPPIRLLDLTQVRITEDTLNAKEDGEQGKVRGEEGSQEGS
jgi:hypothetical protein